MATRPDRSATAIATPRAQIIGGVLGAISVLLMAFAIVLVKPALERSSLIEVTGVRLFFGTVTLLPYVLLRRDRWRVLSVLGPQPSWRRLVPAAFLGTYVSMILWVGGTKYTDASIASVLNQMSVVFTLILGRVFLGEPLSGRRMWGGGASLAGAILILVAS